LKLIEDNPQKRILYVTSRTQIRVQFKEYIEKFIGKPSRKFIPNLKSLLYQGLCRMSDEEIKKLNPDIIIIDEAHHAGGDNKWGAVIQMLFKLFPNAKVLGLTATPERGDKINIIDTLFKGHIASEITLIEAIRKGILKKPKYVTAIYSYKEELDRIGLMIEDCDDKKKKAELVKLYNKAKKMLEKADGLEEVFTKSIEYKEGRYIVYCKDRQHMEEMMAKAKELFAGVDEEPEIYGVASKYGKRYNNDQINRFRNSNSNHLKLMFSVNLLDEGVHSLNADGVILLAEVKSRPSFLQKIGRVFSTDEDAVTPLIIDCRNSYVHHIAKRRDYIVEKREKSKKKKEEIADDLSDIFTVDSQVEEFTTLMSSLDEKINSSENFETTFRKIEEFAKERGRLPRNTKNASKKERNLAEQFHYLRNRTISANIYKDESELDEETKDRIKRIKELVRKYDTEWQVIDAQIEFSNKYGRLSLTGPERSEEERSLALKYKKVRKRLYKIYQEDFKSEEHEFDEYEREDILEKIKVIEELEKKFTAKWNVINEVKVFAQENGKLPSSGYKSSIEERRLANRYANAKIFLSNKKKELGDNTPKDIDEKIEEILRIEMMYDPYWILIKEVEEFAKIHGRLPKEQNSRLSEEEKKKSKSPENDLARKFNNLKRILEKKEIENVDEFTKRMILAVKSLENRFVKEWITIAKTIQFCEKNGRIPSTGKTEESELASEYQSLKNRTIARKKKKEAEGKKISKKDEEILIEVKKIQRKYEHQWQVINKVGDFVRTNHRFPNRMREDEQELAVQFNNVKNKLKERKRKGTLDEDDIEKIEAIEKLEIQCDHQWEILRDVEECYEKNGNLAGVDKKLYNIYLQLTNRIIKNIKLGKVDENTLEKARFILRLSIQYSIRLADRELEKVILERELIQAEELKQMYIEVAREKGIAVEGIDKEKIDGESLDDE